MVPSPLDDGAGLSRFTPLSNAAGPEAEHRPATADPMEAFHDLRLQLLRLTLVITAVAAVVTGLAWGRQPCLSLLAGAAAGLLYLLLLSRNVQRLGKSTSKVGKLHLAVPILLVILALRLDSLAFFPAFLGFLLYKPAVLLIALNDLSTAQGAGQQFFTASPST